MAERSVAELFAQEGPDHAKFSKWVLVNAAARTCHGPTSEKEHLCTYIGMYMDVLTRGGSQDALYKALSCRVLRHSPTVGC